MIILLW